MPVPKSMSIIGRSLIDPTPATDSDDDFATSSRSKRKKIDEGPGPANCKEITDEIGSLKQLLETKFSSIEESKDDLTDDISRLRVQLNGVVAMLEDQTRDLAVVKRNVQDLTPHIAELVTVNERMELPPGSSRCHINQARVRMRYMYSRDSPPTPPIMASSCCKSIVGCRPCIMRWYGSENVLDKNCPKCGTRGAIASTFQFCGIDAFLTSVAAVTRFRSIATEAEDTTNSPAAVEVLDDDDDDDDSEN